jgi:hypothetical protein
MSPVNLKDFEEALERRKAALGLTGYDYVLPNFGASRTPEKRALLRAIADAAVTRSLDPPFKANF